VCRFVILLCDFLYKCGMYIFFLHILVFVVSSPPQLSFFPRSATAHDGPTRHMFLEVDKWKDYEVKKLQFGERF
jgi:hypothetical protein